MAIKGTEIVLEQADQRKDIKLSPGDHTLVIRRDGFRFETDKLALRCGHEVTVRVELLAGEVQIRQGEKLIGQRSDRPYGGKSVPVDRRLEHRIECGTGLVVHERSLQPPFGSAAWQNRCFNSR